LECLYAPALGGFLLLLPLLLLLPPLLPLLPRLRLLLFSRCFACVSLLRHVACEQ
jgi:hypothetical protein